MALLDYFKPVKTWSTDQVKRYLDTHGPQDYNLVDVRQPKEYQRGHLPGAQLIPVKELEERLAELDPRKTTITYCAAGVRSRAAASVLSHADFDEVISMSGGINAWEGLVAEGELEMGTAWFSSARAPEEYLGLAWLLEDGTRQFYSELAITFGAGEEGSFFRQLVVAEEQHKSSLRTLYHGISGGPPGSDFPYSVLPEPPGQTMLEGGLPLAKVLQWIHGRDFGQVLQLAIGLEANAYDRYLLMRREAADEQSRAIFNRLAEEEQIHLRLLTDHLDRWLEQG